MSDRQVTVVAVPPPTDAEKAAEKADTKKWRIILVVGAAAFVLLTIGFQVWASVQTSETTVTTKGTDATTKNGTVTTTESKGPPDTLVSTLAGGAGVLLVAAAFYGRLKKFSFGGAVVEFAGAEASAPEKEAVGDEAKKVVADLAKEPARVAEVEALAVDLVPTVRKPGLSTAEVATLAVSGAVEHLRMR